MPLELRLATDFLFGTSAPAEAGEMFFRFGLVQEVKHHRRHL